MQIFSFLNFVLIYETYPVLTEILEVFVKRGIAWVENRPLPVLVLNGYD